MKTTLKTKFSLVIGVLALSSNLFGAAELTEIRMGTGGQTGSYIKMGQDIAKYCASGSSPEVSVPIIVSEQLNGSLGNLEDINNKKLNAGMTQVDVLFFNKKRDAEKFNDNRIKIIHGLHMETVHLLIPKTYSPSNTGSMWSSFFGKLNSEQALDLNALKNQTIQAKGGSFVSAQALSYFFDLNLNVEAYTGEPDVTKPQLIVAGQPSADVQKLLDTGKFVLIPLDYDRIKSQASFYSKVSANYKANGVLASIPTIGVQALLVGKSFRKKDSNVAMQELATCISENIADMADDDTTNPNWETAAQLTDKDNLIDWNYFELLNQPEDEGKKDSKKK